MIPLMIALSVFVMITGVFVAAGGIRPGASGALASRRSVDWAGILRSRWRLTRAAQIQLVAGLAAGVAAFALTGWLLALPAIPLAVVGLPRLLAEPANREVELLQALDRWVRGLASSLPTGKSIHDAIRSTAAQAPPRLAEPLATLIVRLNQRWTTREALVAFADDLDSPDADAVIAALVMAAHRGGVGATRTLTALSESIQHRLRALREIDAERAKPRVVVRQVTIITVVVLAAAFILSGSYFAPYRSPVGQLLLMLLVAAYVGSLQMLRRRTVPRRRERILQRAKAEPSPTRAPARQSQFVEAS